MKASRPLRCSQVQPYRPLLDLPIKGMCQGHCSATYNSHLLCVPEIVSDNWQKAWRTKVRTRSGPVTCACTGTLSSVGLHTDEEFKAFTPWDGYNKNITYRNGRCPARVYMDDIHKLVKQKFWGDPLPGEKLITYRVSLHDEAAVREAYDKFEKRIDNCTKVLLVP